MNLNDVFPRRNLPGDQAEEWGRVVEQRIQSLEFGTVRQGQLVSGENRASASSMEELSRQVRRLAEQRAQLEAAIRALPRTVQSTTQSSGFGLGGGWNTVLTASITVPAGMTQAKVLVVGSGQTVSNTTVGNVESSYRLILNGSASPQSPSPWFPGSGDFRSIITPSYGWNLGVSPGATLTAQFQIAPQDSSSWPPHGDSYAVLTLQATFTG